MCTYDLDGSTSNLEDYNVEIDSDYYNQDYDDVDIINSEINEYHNDSGILFE